MNWIDQTRRAKKKNNNHDDCQRVIKCLCVQQFNSFYICVSFYFVFSPRPFSRFFFCSNVFSIRSHANCWNYGNAFRLENNNTMHSEHAKIFGQFKTIEIPLIFTFSVFPLEQPKMELHLCLRFEFLAWNKIEKKKKTEKKYSRKIMAQWVVQCVPINCSTFA